MRFQSQSYVGATGLGESGSMLRSIALKSAGFCLSLSLSLGHKPSKLADWRYTVKSGHGMCQCQLLIVYLTGEWLSRQSYSLKGVCRHAMLDQVYLQPVPTTKLAGAPFLKDSELVRRAVTHVCCESTLTSKTGNKWRFSFS